MACDARTSTYRRNGWRVVQSLVMVNGHPMLSEPKTSASRRVIALDPATIAALRRNLASQAEERLAWGPAYEDSGLCFTRENRAPLSPEWFADRFGQIAIEARLPASASTTSVTASRRRLSPRAFTRRSSAHGSATPR